MAEHAHAGAGRRGWVDFARVKEAARFEAILERYGIAFTKKGSELTARCPFQEETRPSLRVSTEKQVFHCFGCGAKGGPLEFVMMKSGVSIKQAAMLVGEWSGLTASEIRVQKGSEGPRNRRREPESAKTASASLAGDAPVEPPKTEGGGLRPLTFTLKLDPEHPYLKERGLDAESVKTFGVGHCSRGMMKDRIAIPIHDEAGNLVAYVGRWPGDPPKGEERYKLPAGFKKSEVLFNLHRVKGAEEIVLVEGAFGVFRLHALGIPACALLGRDLSARQEELLAASGAKRVVLLLDGDGPGKEAATAILPRLARRFFVRVVELPEDAQPDTLEEKELRNLLGR